MKEQNHSKKTYVGMKFKLMMTPANVKLTRTYDTIVNPSSQNNIRRRKTLKDDPK